MYIEDCYKLSHKIVQLCDKINLENNSNYVARNSNDGGCYSYTVIGKKVGHDKWSLSWITSCSDIPNDFDYTTIPDSDMFWLITELIMDGNDNRKYEADVPNVLKGYKKGEIAIEKHFI